MSKVRMRVSSASKVRASEEREAGSASTKASKRKKKGLSFYDCRGRRALTSHHVAVSKSMGHSGDGMRNCTWICDVALSRGGRMSTSKRGGCASVCLGQGFQLALALGLDSAECEPSRPCQMISSASGMERGEVFYGPTDWLGSRDPMTHIQYARGSSTGLAD
jgi:hypothetical protein